MANKCGECQFFPGPHEDCKIVHYRVSSNGVERCNGYASIFG